MEGELIRRADIMAGLTSAEMQKKLKQGTGEEAYNAFLEMVNLSPAADVVEVVRCKDCKWSGSNWIGTLGSCAINIHLVNAGGFCSDGERKE